MRFFISSVISGFEAEREAAIRAVRALRHEALSAEDFPAGSGSPQSACLSGVRQSDAVVLLLGERDGVPGPAMEACLKNSGAEALFSVTECFV